MDKPYIICHMVTSLDGKVTGDFLRKSEYSHLIEDYYRIHREYGANAFLCGRVTMESSFPQPPTPPEPYTGKPIVREDYVAESAAFYAIAIDSQGKLWWQNHTIADADPGYHGAHIVEVLTQNVSDTFLAHLRKKGISYLFGGETELDLVLVVQKLKKLFGIEKLLLEGGGIVNGSFLQAGLVDEISLVVVPAVEGSEKSMSLFKTGIYPFSSKSAASFRLKDAQRLTNDGLWLTYQKR
nr:dihydrofolate reductase family protein [uncultured Anaeromusa sp.]